MQRGDSAAQSVTKIPVIEIGSDRPSVDVVVCGAYHVCVLTAAKRVRCWGDNYYGEVRRDEGREEGKRRKEKGNFVKKEKRERK